MHDERAIVTNEAGTEVCSCFVEHVENVDSGAEIRLRDARRPFLTVRRSAEAGFSLLELIVVVTIIGILASVAIVNVRYAQRKAREAALKDNLFQMRKAIDNFYADKQRYPSDLNELVPNYIRKIPADPITDQVDWETVMDDPFAMDGGYAADPDPQSANQPGVIDVKSSAEGTTMDDVPYSEL